jgi:hypothetical protein
MSVDAETHSRKLPSLLFASALISCVGSTYILIGTLWFGSFYFCFVSSRSSADL